MSDNGDNSDDGDDGDEVLIAEAAMSDDEGDDTREPDDTCEPAEGVAFHPRWGVYKGPNALGIGEWWTNLTGRTSPDGGDVAIIPVDSPHGGLSSELDAKAFLLGHMSPDGLPKTVAFVGVGGLEPAGAAKTRAALRKARAKLSDLRAKSLASLMGAKSPKVGCKSCGSSLARKYLADVMCPVCRIGCLVPPTVKVRIEAAETAIASLASAVEADLRQPRVERKGAYFLVGDMAPVENHRDR